jgi:hypothetical protein
MTKTFYENWGYRHYIKSEECAIKFCTLLAEAPHKLDFCRNDKNKKYLNPRSKIVEDFPNNITNDFPGCIRKSLLAQKEMIGEWKVVQDLFVAANINRLSKTSISKTKAAKTAVNGVAREAITNSNSNSEFNFPVYGAKNGTHARKVISKADKADKAEVGEAIQTSTTEFDKKVDRRKLLLRNSRIRDNVNKKCFSVMLLKDNIEISKDFANKKFARKCLPGDPESSFKGGLGEEAGTFALNEMSPKFSSAPYKLIANTLVFKGGDGGTDHYWHGYNVDIKYRSKRNISLAVEECIKKNVIYIIFSGEDVNDINSLDSFDAYLADLAVVIYNNKTYSGYDAVDFLIDCVIKDENKNAASF